MAIVTIGGADYAVPVMSFAALKACWGDIKALATTTDMVGQGEIAIRVVAAALAARHPDLTAPVIEERATVAEFPALIAAVVEILREAGLVPTGEPMPAPTAAAG